MLAIAKPLLGDILFFISADNQSLIASAKFAKFTAKRLQLPRNL